MTFATSGKDSRTTQMFINLFDNSSSVSRGFSPFARVVLDDDEGGSGGMEVVDQLFSGHGEGTASGKGPDQGRIQSEGNKCLKRQFPNLSCIKSVRPLPNSSSSSTSSASSTSAEEEL
uniref:Uncharacterized protein n=1 Tax=Asterionellopsis glacialis TaxID=33640 RepID=A0A7S0KYZ2_9STRA|mmetsp:Transcript_1750/g.2529  ORF Transcript_1750/g.2529 Transcript_1750/m.2529 type:complete len:118 (+) Transcript_1750:370-723(+)